MAFKEVSSLDCDTTVAIGGVNRKTGKKNPAQIEGYFIGSKQVPDNKKKSGFSYLHILQTAKGNIGVWGKTDLDRKLGTVPAGAMIRVTHSGMVPTPNGEMYKYKVEVDASNSIDVASVEQPAQDEPAVEDAYEEVAQDDAEEEAVEEPVPPPAAPPARAATTPSADRQAKVRALLAGGRK